MIYRHLTYEQQKVQGHLSAFQPMEGVAEYNAVLCGTDATINFDAQLRNILDAYDTLLKSLPDSTKPVMVRFMLSDPANQVQALPDDLGCAVSAIGQPPVSGAKVAMWAYFQSEMTHTQKHWLQSYTHGDYEHLWLGGAWMTCGSAADATEETLARYDEALHEVGANMADCCQRTWLFVRDVDVNYRGVVVGRNKYFDRIGLTKDTHFIASTGISGYNADYHAVMTLDAYAVKGLQPGQVTYLKASEYLNPTAEYGVAFERGTAITYGDRRHVLISGTASINNRGEVVYPGDIRRQCERMMQNISALIAEGGCDMSDLTHMIIYLRDMADYQVVKAIFDEKYASVPRVIVLAPVCRPGWLIEVECMAINDNGDSRYSAL